MDLFEMLSFVGGVALFLYGMQVMGGSIRRLAGGRFKVVLHKLTSNKWWALLLGTGVTALIQSSSATSVMVVGFVNAGMMQFSQAISIILGSILGTSITGWIACLSDLGGSQGIASLLSTTTITGIFAAVGIYLFKFSKKRTNNHIGSILMGFAVTKLLKNLQHRLLLP